ncbi:hypothetical protein GALL_355390 [mine drainage metagenome]|uniref:Uncharacterized protein n=1 Tax=mine drainage metagenome TaxID=410659 RepID=A0A1J5QYZ5_9ZZZZ
MTASAPHSATMRTAATRARSPARIPAVRPRVAARSSSRPASDARREKLPETLSRPRRVPSPSITSSCTTKAVCSSSTAAPTCPARVGSCPPNARYAAATSAGRNRLPPWAAASRLVHRSRYSGPTAAERSVPLAKNSSRRVSWWLIAPPPRAGRGRPRAAARPSRG